jgi:DNA helicase II / ATP-dependent DNA helicase PcrA
MYVYSFLFFMSDILSSLNEQQQQVVQATHGPVLVLAGAGSGKTRALTHRIAYILQQKIASPHQILAVTFTNKAASEMKERVQQLMRSPEYTPASIGTFHSIGARMLREQAAFHPRSKTFVIVDAKDSERLVRQALKELDLSVREWNPRTLKHRISEAKNTLQSPDDIANASASPADEVLSRVFTRYEALLAKQDAYDFDDLLRVPTDILSRYDNVRTAYQQRWRFLSVDEYQDTNPLQEQLLTLLLGPEKNICVVGDDYQAIYSWRGANVDHILRFESRYPQCHVIYLTQNYRSTPHILEAANMVIAENTQQKHKKLWTGKREGDAVRVVAVPTDRHEARFVRTCIEDHLNRGGALKDCTILYRTNAQSRLFEEEFLTHRIPYTIIGGFRFYDRREVKDALAFLHFWVNPASRLGFDRLADALLSRVGPKTIDRWEKQATERHISLERFIVEESRQRPQLQPLAKAYTAARQTFPNEEKHVSDLLRLLLTKSGYLDMLAREADGEERLENIEELLNVTSAYTSVETFLEDASLLSDIDTLEEVQDRVTCMTLHAAKGLEFPVVFLAGCEEGLLPHSNSIDKPASLEEERRLMYVGITRAQQLLTITHALQRFSAGEMQPQSPSRFLASLPDTVVREGTNTQEQEHEGLHDFLFHTSKTEPINEPIMLTVSQGEFVSHPRFGRGVVVDIQGGNVTCVFEGYGVKIIPHNEL